MWRLSVLLTCRFTTSCQEALCLEIFEFCATGKLQPIGILIKSVWIRNYSVHVDTLLHIAGLFIPTQMSDVSTCQGLKGSNIWYSWGWTGDCLIFIVFQCLNNILIWKYWNCCDCDQQFTLMGRSVFFRWKEHSIFTHGKIYQPWCSNMKP